MRHKYEIMVAQKVRLIMTLDWTCFDSMPLIERHSAVGKKYTPHAQKWRTGPYPVTSPTAARDSRPAAQQAGDVFTADRIGAVHLESEFRWNELTALVNIPLDQPPHRDHRGVIAS